MNTSISGLQKTLSGKRIIFVLYSFELGGAERQALYLARYLQNTCHADVEIWAFCNPGRLIEICDEYHIKWRLIPIKIGFDQRQIIYNSIQLGLALFFTRPDILLPYLTPANIYCGLIWRFTGAKLCIWNQRNAGHTIYNLKFEKKAAHNVSAHLTNTKMGAEFILSTYKVPRERVHVFHNGVELSAPKAEKKIMRSRYKIDKYDFIVCMLANLHGNKDHTTLLHAWARVVKRLNKPAGLLLAGRFDSTYETLKDLVKELGIEKNVIFLGSVKEIPDLLQIVDVGILTSPSKKGEGMSNAILEYMFAGLPVISTDIPSIRETVGKENYKYLAPVKDANQLSKLILDFANDNELCQEIGQKNRERARKSFPLDQMCRYHTDLIYSLLTQHNGT